MKRHAIEYHDEFRPGPLTFWVHRHLDAEVWVDAKRHDPPLPGPVPGRGYATHRVEIEGIELVFASPEEIRHCIDVLGRRALPTPLALSAGRGLGPNRHWLSRLPARVMPWRVRERIVAHLRRVLAELEAT